MGKLRYSYKAEVSIKTDIETAWQSLISIENYERWNSFTPMVKTNWEIGSVVHLTVQMQENKSPIIQKEKLLRFEPETEIAWGIDFGPFLKAERVQRITKTSDGVSYFTEDVIWGLLSPIVNLIYGKHIQKGFERVANGLKSYCENGFT